MVPLQLPMPSQKDLLVRVVPVQLCGTHTVVVLATAQVPPAAQVPVLPHGLLGSTVH
jgi:hypothetical protein